MTRITTFQVAGILVAALMCFSEVCYVDSQTTTGPTTMTDVTTAAPTTTTGPATTTVPATTTGPATTTASNMTTTASNMTTTFSNMTTTFSNMTTTFSNMTTIASNMTTTASNMTTTFSNMTTTASNMTTAASNMTTENGMTSTTPSVTSGGTTPAPEARWKVKDKNGKLCMLMDFGGSITDLIKGVTVQIPSDASTSSSNCSSSSYSVFALSFSTITTRYGIEMSFTARGGSFELHTLAAGMSSGTMSYSSSETTDFFDVPLGDYYTCSHFNYTLGLFQLNFTNPSLQPFVQKTEGGDNMGKPYDCRTDHDESHIGIIVGVVVGVIVIIAVIVVTFVVVKRRRNPSPPSYIKA